MESHQDADRLEKGGLPLRVLTHEDPQIRGNLKRERLEAAKVHEAQRPDHAAAFPDISPPSMRKPHFPLEFAAARIKRTEDHKKCEGK